MLAITVWLPTATMIFCYSAIFIKLKMTAKRFPYLSGLSRSIHLVRITLEHRHLRILGFRDASLFNFFVDSLRKYDLSLFTLLREKILCLRHVFTALLKTPVPEFQSRALLSKIRGTFFSFFMTTELALRSKVELFSLLCNYV